MGGVWPRRRSSGRADRAAGPAAPAVELADYGHNHGERRWSPAAEIRPAGAGARQTGHARRRADASPRAARPATRDERVAPEQSRAIASFEQHRHILRTTVNLVPSAAPRAPYPQSQPQVAGILNAGGRRSLELSGAAQSAIHSVRERAPGAGRQLAVRQHLPELETRRAADPALAAARRYRTAGPSVARCVRAQSSGTG